jgi:hypothetical protein
VVLEGLWGFWGVPREMSGASRDALLRKPGTYEYIDFLLAMVLKVS